MRVVVIEGRTKRSEGVHGRVAKWLIGLPCHKIHGLPLAKSSCITIPWCNYVINTARRTADTESVEFFNRLILKQSVNQHSDWGEKEPKKHWKHFVSA